ncbi:EamA family transporter [Alphaproteobacteria bacterium]|nr:EamA family transporter [Alphaproteobacteria bacterium]
MLNYIQILQLVSFAMLMSIGQVLFKKTAVSMSTNEALSLFDGLIKAISTPWFYLALSVYALATVFWLYLLQRIPLSLAYPFSALAMLIVPILAMYLFGERVNLSYWLGLTFIILGIIIVAL